MNAAVEAGERIKQQMNRVVFSEIYPNPLMKTIPMDDFEHYQKVNHNWQELKRYLDDRMKQDSLIWPEDILNKMRVLEGTDGKYEKDI